MADADRNDRGILTGCVESAALFQDPLLEQPPSASAPTVVRRRSESLHRQADAVCGACPVFAECLFRAVVDHDVAGFAASTTERERTEIRRLLAVTVEPEDFDTLAGVTRAHRQVDHDEVVRLRNANPQESLECLARRLGCSLSTVKRHLRKERSAGVRQINDKPRPTQFQVISAFVAVTSRRMRRPRAAA